MEIVSNCCGSKTYSPDGEGFTCMECKEPCEAVNLDRQPCGEGENICNCKDAAECGYIEFYAGIEGLKK